jgi:hypothetical protein
MSKISRKFELEHNTINFNRKSEKSKRNIYVVMLYYTNYARQNIWFKTRLARSVDLHSDTL